MRIELRDYMGMVHVCDTTDMDLMAKWFKSWIPEMLNVNMTMPTWQIQIWPVTETEFAYFKDSQSHNKFTRSQFVNSDNMYELADIFKYAGDQMKILGKDTRNGQSV